MLTFIKKKKKKKKKAMSGKSCLVGEMNGKN